VPIRHDGWVAQLQDVVFDCRHPASVARFWAAALDGYQVAPYDDAELARRRALWKAPPPRYTRGLLAKYMKLVSTASLGAITDGG